MASNESAVLFDQPGPKGRKTIRIVNWVAGIVFAIVLVLMLMRLHNPPDGENQLPDHSHRFRRHRGIRPSRTGVVAHDLLLALVCLRGPAKPGLLGRGTRIGDL